MNINPGNYVFQSCCIPRLENNIASASYIFDTHQPILTFFVDNKVVLLCTVCEYYFRLAISFLRHGIQHD